MEKEKGSEGISSADPATHSAPPTALANDSEPAAVHWVVGIGASAGGLEAMRPLVRELRPTGPLTYIVAQHLPVTGNLMAGRARLPRRRSAARADSSDTVLLALQLADSLELLLGTLRAHLRHGQGKSAVGTQEE